MALRRCLLILALVLSIFAGAVPSQVQAQALPDLLAGLTESDPKPALEQLMASDSPQAKAALAALAASKLYRRIADGAVIIGEPDGNMIVVTNAATGDMEDMAAPADLELIQLSDDAKADLAAAGVGGAEAETPKDFASAVIALNAEDFAAKGKAIEVLTQLGDARAVPVLRAMTDGRLFTRKSDGAVVIADRAGNQQSLTLATTLESAGMATNAELDPVVVNNNLRGALREAVGRLGLLNPDPAQRRLAAAALLENATPDAVALLREVMPKETNAKAREVMALSLAAADIADPAADKQRKLAAVATLSGATDLRVRSLLQGRLAAETDVDVKAALQSAFTSVQRKLTVIGWFANIFQGISLGSVLLLAAVGLAITFGVMGVINMAHGEMIMIGAYATYVVQEIFRAYLPPAWFGGYLVAALPVAFVVAGLFGIAIERGVIRFLYGRPLETMLATWGISLILQQLVRSIFGAPNKEVSNPSWMTGSYEVIGGFDVTWNRVIIIIFCFLVLGLIALILRRTSFGLHMRAVTQNRGMASVMGIPTAKVDALTFALGSGIAGMAGVALSQIGNVSPNLGTIYIVDSFLVVVFGGVGNLMGTLVGAMTLGIVNKLLEPVAGAVLGKVVVLVAIILFIQKRPRGLFAAKGRSADA
ncbi:urea ABC transporter permease subunit UrtB [Ferrovibrio sp.]|uniref:urea ABC transporter permease subunit UrtB n=1 Tax=Ferrovibrio sp. TaxID=1917215 RepID=UPI003D0B5E45